jgi:hypothetical protein
MNEEWRDQPGYAAHFIQRIGQQVFKSMPISWAEHIPEINISISKPLRNAVWAWYSLGTSLSRAQIPLNEIKRDWIVLLAGLRLTTITSWLRALALELEADSNWMIASNIDLSVEWEIEDAILRPDINSITDLNTFFKDGVSRLNQSNLDTITPLGWLALVAGQMGLIGQKSNAPLDYEWAKTLPDAENNSANALLILREKIKHLAHCLILPPIETTNIEQWPFEYINNSLEIGSFWNEEFLLDTVILLTQLECLCGFQVIEVTNAPWRLDPREHKFTDTDVSTLFRTHG